MKRWQEEWVVYMLDNWQKKYTAREVAGKMNTRFNRRFTKNSVIGMLKRLRDEFGSDEIDGDRYAD